METLLFRNKVKISRIRFCIIRFRLDRILSFVILNCDINRYYILRHPKVPIDDKFAALAVCTFRTRDFSHLHANVFKALLLNRLVLFKNA